MNRDIVERSASYELLSEYLSIPKETIKSHFKRHNKDIKDIDYVGRYIDRNLFNRGGVYMIQNIANKKIYIGQSQNIADRWSQHKHSLKLGKHSNNDLQSDFKLYGRDCFIFSIIEFVDDIESRKMIEIELIKKFGYENIYNCDSVFYGWNKIPPEIRKGILDNYDDVVQFIINKQKTGT